MKIFRRYKTMYDGIENTTLNSVHIANVVSERMRTDPNMSLTLTQKKLIFYLISLIQETDTNLKRTSITFSDFFKFSCINLGINKDRFPHSTRNCGKR